MSKAKYLPPISEARIQAGIASYPDNPELTEEEFAGMRPAREVLPPELYAALTRRTRAEPADQSTTEEVTIALDRAVFDHFRATGPGWQGRVNEALSLAIAADLSRAIHPQAG